ncbi:serine hydrolase domain-containing protein [Spartinivicinus ruber]|uniref:serine hydrolase domain-containing protein n=1 Tax=Spartinivicinus ruber TaxID=2683272 RepID=UPI0013D31F44|nr:serine hydrolase [Spartinivicinus ruber]
MLKLFICLFISIFLASNVAATTILNENYKTAEELGLMKGSPPLANKQVNQSNFIQPPFNRWSLQHIRELMPTREVFKGSGTTIPLKSNPANLGLLEISLAQNKKITIDDWLRNSYTDGFLVLHNGVLVFEKYFNEMKPYTQHQMFSVTKSFTGTLTLLLANQGLIDLTASVKHYIPELENSGFADATVQQILDMTNNIQFNETYSDPNADIWRFATAIGVKGLTSNIQQATSIYSFLKTLQKDGKHGEAFHYATPTTEVLGWIISRVSNQTLSKVLHTNIWSRLGAERDGYYWLDNTSTEMASGGLSITLRDAARFGQMILQKGYFNNQQILPKQVATRILKAGNPSFFNKHYQDEWYQTIGYSYHDQWWTFNNAHKAVAALGVHGQLIYLDPVANMVIIKQSSDPEAESYNNEFIGPKVYQTIANHLLQL